MSYLSEKYSNQSQRHLCLLLGLEESTYYYKSVSKPRLDEEKLVMAMKEFTQKKTRHGRNRVVWHLRTVCGFKDNHKRIARIYRELGLQVGRRIKGKKRRSGLRLVLTKPVTPIEIWAMDFVSDSFASGRRFRALTVTDLFTHECPRIEVDISLTGDRVAQVLNELKLSVGLPKAIICDNGPEFISNALDRWSFENKVELKFIQPGKPNQNAYCESFNARLRDECLNTNWFIDLNDAKQTIEKWRIEYNEENPHSSLGMMPPKTFAIEYQKGLAS